MRSLGARVRRRRRSLRGSGQRAVCVRNNHSVQPRANMARTTRTHLTTTAGRDRTHHTPPATTPAHTWHIHAWIAHTHSSLRESRKGTSTTSAVHRCSEQTRFRCPLMAASAYTSCLAYQYCSDVQSDVASAMNVGTVMNAPSTSRHSSEVAC